MAIRRQIDLRREQSPDDSFNSTNAAASTAGQYDPLKARMHGDIAAYLGLTNSNPVNLGNASIFGNAVSGLYGTWDVGPAGLISGMIGTDITLNFLR